MTTILPVNEITVDLDLSEFATKKELTTLSLAPDTKSDAGTLSKDDTATSGNNNCCADTVSMIADFNSQNAVLIHYRGGAYGNFLYRVIGTHIDNTVKIKNDNFSFSSTGDSHSTFKYISRYYLAGELDKKDKKITSYHDYKYVPSVTNKHAWQQIQDGKNFLVLCDTSVIDNHRYLLSMWPNSVMIRTVMPTFIDKLVGYANLLHKAGVNPVSVYKNSLFDQQTIEKFKSQGGDFDQTVVDATVQLFQQDFGFYGKTFNKPVDHQQIFNFYIKDLLHWKTFKESMEGIAKFLNAKVVDYPGLQNLYNNFYKTQSNLKYYSFNKDSIAHKDDLTGRALIKFYQQ